MIGGRHWIGGYNYLLNIFRVLRKYGTGQVQPVLFVGDDFPESDLAPFATIGYDIVRSAAFDRRRQHRSLASAMITGKDREAERIFQAHDIDVVFEVANFLGWRLGFPAVAWIPDFQHRHLSHMFSKNAYWRRELGLRAQVKTGRMIMLSSENARRSCEQFYPSSCGRTHVVRFAVQLDEAILAIDPEEVRARHGLPENFIYLPNQFWRHKNHRIVIEALALFPNSHVVIASTGHGVDPRHPTLYEELRSLVNQNGLQKQFRFIGMVPYSDVIALMRGATAVLNPSLFEGWSTTVEEARALGVPLILSDIAVHREQMGNVAQYFSPDSPEELATLLRPQVSASRPNKVYREAAAAANTERVYDFARNLEAVFAQATHV
jgi:glycosyltransferase involved in cell wall biosynthesis